MRSEIGKLSLDILFQERENLNASIVDSINEASAEWGITCIRYEIRDITPPRTIQAAMEMQAEAERRRRALILDSEGEREAEVNIAKGKRDARVLASEAEMEERINLGKGEAAAIEAKASASATATSVMARAIQSSGGSQAVSTRLAEQYISAFGGIAKKGNTLVLPADAADVGSMVAHATGVYRAIVSSSGGESDIGAAVDQAMNDCRTENVVPEEQGASMATSEMGPNDDNANENDEGSRGEEPLPTRLE